LTLLLMATATAEVAAPLQFPHTVGSGCEEVLRAERGRGGKQVTTQVNPVSDTIWYEGRYGGRPATISYVCLGGKVESHYIATIFLEEAPAKKYLQAQMADFRSKLGSPCTSLEKMNATDRRRLQQERPGVLESFLWQASKSVIASVAFEFSPSDGGWNVHYISYKGTLACSTRSAVPPNNRMQRSAR
jgi:hypothetical protein